MSSEFLTDMEWSCDNCTYINPNNNLTCEMCFHVRPSTRTLAVIWEWAPNVDQWIPYDGESGMQIESKYQEWKTHKESEEQEDRNASSSSATHSTSTSSPSPTTASPSTVVSSATSPSPSPPSSSSFFSRRVPKPSPHSTPHSSFHLSAGWFRDNPGYSVLFGDGKGKRGHQQISPNGMIRQMRRIGDDDNNLFQSMKKCDIAKDDKCPICQVEFGDQEEEEEDEGDKGKNVDGKEKEKEKSKDSDNDKNKISSDTSLDSSIVKLPHCVNHYFHRECIAQWVKLKDHCPQCKKKIQ